MSELRADDAIHAEGVLPPGLRLPDVTAVEYVRGVAAHVQRVLGRHPPPAPTPAAVRLVEAMARLQDFVGRHGYAAAAARLDARELFGAAVHRWLAASAAGLRRALRALDRAGPPAAATWQEVQAEGRPRVSPLVEGMLGAVDAEMRRYERVVQHWPSHGPDLEAALVASLRDSVGAASRQCGLQQAKESDRVAWRWAHSGGGGGGGGGGAAFAGAPPALRRGITPHQALLLNSLRRLLAVVPLMERSLAAWCGTAPGGATAASHAAFPPPPTTAAERLARDAPDLGAHWAQLVKELRTEYFACITLCAEALAAGLAADPATSVLGVLRAEAAAAGGGGAAPAAAAQRLRRCLAATSPLLRWLGAALDGRVLVAVGRGLWDLAARDVLRFATDLTEDGGGGGGGGAAWRGRQHAAAAARELDAFYRGALGAAMGSDVRARDLAPPQHAARAAALLADTAAGVGESFDVY
jgi:hypothetical protein